MAGTDEQLLLDDFVQYSRAANLAETTIANRLSILRGLQSAIDGPLSEATTRELRAAIAKPGIGGDPAHLADDAPGVLRLPDRGRLARR